MKHNNNFDFLRFLFSFLVIIGHAILLCGTTEFRNEFFASMPNYSVFSFFVISGFLVYSSYERLNNTKKYFSNRMKRILPAYLFVVLFCSFFLFAFSNVGFREYFSKEWLQYVGVNIVFMNFLKPCINYVFAENSTCAVNGSLWTIKVELMFYVFVPFLFLILKKLSLFYKNIFLILLYLLSLAYFHIVMNTIDNYVIAKQLPGSLTYFVSGILLYLNLNFFRKNIKFFLVPAIIIIILEKIYLNTNILFPFALGVVIIWFAYLDLPLKNFGKYGDFSYGMYLLHFPIIQIMIQTKMFEYHFFVGLFLSTVITIITSVLLWKFIEKPFLQKKFIQKPA